MSPPGNPSITIRGDFPEFIEVIPRSWNVVPAFALPILFIISPLTLPCKAEDTSDPPTPVIRSFADMDVTELVTCFFSNVPYPITTTSSSVLVSSCSCTLKDVCPATDISFDIYPTNEISKVAFSGTLSNLAIPSISVIFPFVVPFTATLAPTTGPTLSLTVTVTVLPFCKGAVSCTMALFVSFRSEA